MRRRILVCDVQHPFADDLWAPFVETLVQRLAGAGFAVDVSRIPVPRNPSGPHLEDALVWRLLDLARGGGEGVDLMLALRFPAWVGRHPRKVVWTLPDVPPETSGEPDEEEKRWELGHRALGEARRVFAATPVQCEALARRGVEADLLTPPPPRPPAGSEDPWPPVLDALTWIL